MDERDRKELSRLIGSAVRRIKEATIDQYEKGLRTYMNVAANYERRVLASLVRGVLDEVGVERKLAAEVERLINTSKNVEAHDLLLQVIEARKVEVEK